MKKIIFITLLFCGLAFSAQSQSLTYSKVILLTSLDTVPQGKVWKITAYLPSSHWIVGSSGDKAVTIKLNNQNRYLTSSRGDNNYGKAAAVAPMPIWIPAGTTLEPYTLCGSLSIIEFTETNE